MELSSKFDTESKAAPTYTIPQNVVEEQAKELSLAHTILKDWETHYYATCLQNLQSLPVATQPKSVQILASILMPIKPHKRVSGHDKTLIVSLHELALARLIDSPSPEAIPALTIALFHANKSIASTAEAALHLKGAPIVPSLLTVLMQPTMPDYWTEKGIVAILRLLAVYGDSRASHTLIRVAQKELPTASDALVISALRVAILFSSLFMIPMGFWGLYSFLTGGEMSLTLLLMSFCGWLMGYCMLTFFMFLPTLFLMIPFAIGQERAKQRRFSSLALQALKQIKDKRMLPYLIRLTWSIPIPAQPSSEALDALVPILPLITKEDASLLSFSSDEELLCNALGKHSTSVTLSNLHTLECIGTETSLHRLKRLVRRSELAEVRERASAVYEVVKARADLKKEKRVLLRASHAPQETTDLLRPAQDAPLEGRDELLHPAAPPIEQGGTSHAETD